MYPSATPQADAGPRPGFGTIVASLGAVLALSVVGFASLLAIAHFLPDTGTKAYWFISRSSGVVAYGLLTLGVLWGLIQSGGLFRSRLSPLLALGLHSYLNWTGLALAGLHAAILLGDSYLQIDLVRIITPFLSPYRPLPVGLGITGFYLMLLLSLSFYARMHLGQRSFRLLHYASFLAYLLVTLHSLLAGTDSQPLWWFYTLSLAAVVVFTVLRVASTLRTRRRQPVQPRRQPAAGASRWATPPPHALRRPRRGSQDMAMEPQTHANRRR